MTSTPAPTASRPTAMPAPQRRPSTRRPPGPSRTAATATPAPRRLPAGPPRRPGPTRKIRCPAVAVRGTIRTRRRGPSRAISYRFRGASPSLSDPHDPYAPPSRSESHAVRLRSQDLYGDAGPAASSGRGRRCPIRTIRTPVRARMIRARAFGSESRTWGDVGLAGVPAGPRRLARSEPHLSPSGPSRMIHAPPSRFESHDPFSPPSRSSRARCTATLAPRVFRLDQPPSGSRVARFVRPAVAVEANGRYGDARPAASSGRAASSSARGRVGGAARPRCPHPVRPRRTVRCSCRRRTRCPTPVRRIRPVAGARRRRVPGRYRLTARPSAPVPAPMRPGRGRRGSTRRRLAVVYDIEGPGSGWGSPGSPGRLSPP